MSLVAVASADHSNGMKKVKKGKGQAFFLAMVRATRNKNKPQSIMCKQSESHIQRPEKFIFNGHDS